MDVAFFEQEDIDTLAPILDRMGLELILVPDGEAPFQSGFLRFGDLELPPDVGMPIVTPGREMWIRRTNTSGEFY